MLSRTATTLLLTVITVGAGLHLYVRLANRPDEVAAPADAYPPGRWMRIAPSVPAGDGELDRLLSLPYLQGKIEAGRATGVVHHDPEAAFDGFNLYCSGHAPEAVLMDMKGKVLHRWRLGFEEAFPGERPDTGSLYFRRVALLPDGHLLALFQGWGMVRLDRDSRLVWVLRLSAFNDFYQTASGSLLVLEKKARILPEIHPEEPVLEDFIVELSPDGEEIGRWSLLELFRRSRYAPLLDSMRSKGDILHSNTVTLLEDSTLVEGPFRPHRILVSLRDVDTIGVIDREEERVEWAARGSWQRQHEPVLLPSGRILLFDNLGGRERQARAIEIEPESGEIQWSWGDEEGQALVSPEGGSVARLANGNTLITASESGRVVEVTPSGTVAWEFLSPHRAGPRRELVATLWELLRLDGDSVTWLERPAG